APLAARERGDRLLVRLPAREEEAPEKRLRLRPAQARRGDGRVEDRPALVELDLVLGEVGDLDAVADADAAAVRRAPTEDRLEQRRLAGAVRPDERHVLAALERERRVAEQLLVARAQVEALH